MLIEDAIINDIYNIEKCGKRCLPIYYKATDLYFLINQNNYKIMKLCNDNKLYGYTVIEKRINSNHIMSIGIYPQYRRRGYGEMLINKIKDMHVNKTITLNVQKNNEAAICFYKKNGFKIIGELINYYSNLECKDAYKMAYLDESNITINPKMIT